MAASMKVSGKITNYKAVENSSGLMAEFTKVDMFKILNMAREFFAGQMDECMMESGLKANNMVKESLKTKAESLRQEFGSMGIY